MQIDETTVDVENVIQRIQAVRRGELPKDAVSVEELRAAIEAQRRRFSLPSATAPDTSGADKPAAKRSAKPKIQLNLDGLGF